VFLREDFPVLNEMSSGNGCESLFQCAIRSGGIDKQYIKPEQAEEGNDDQYDIG